jgi:hypothetical protein
MKTEQIADEWPRYEVNDPPLDLTRENAAFERERPRLVRDHLGQIALIRGDEVVGAFPNLETAFDEGVRRFGYVRFICRPITEKDEPEWFPYPVPNDPSVRRLD